MTLCDITEGSTSRSEECFRAHFPDKQSEQRKDKKRHGLQWDDLGKVFFLNNTEPLNVQTYVSGKKKEKKKKVFRLDCGH